MAFLIDLTKTMLRWSLIVAEALWWLLFLIAKVLRGAWHLVHLAHALRHAAVLCPRGHVVPASGGTYRCSRCSFIFEGSIWLCGNPACQAVTPHCSCPTCGLSVLNPYRLEH